MKKSIMVMLCIFTFLSLTESMQASEALIYEYETQELYAQRDGNQIYGLLYMPKDAGEEMPAVIFSHGFGGNHQVGAQYAEALAGKGYVVYCFDFCGGRVFAEDLLDYDIYGAISDYKKDVLLIHGDDFTQATEWVLAYLEEHSGIVAI